MPVRPEPWPAGVPAWVDLVVTDLAVATEFYGRLFGWTFHGAEPGAAAVPEHPVHLTALTSGAAAAGISTPTGGQHPTGWTTYLATEDVEETIRLATHEGATVLVPAHDLEGSARSAVITDPTGAVVGLWQSGAHTGADVTDEVGAMTWTEVLTDDVPMAMAFYSVVFGHTHTDMSAAGFTYATFAVDGRLAGGIGALDGAIAAQDSPHWLVYFAVADVDAAVETVQDTGGGVVRPAWDSPFGRIALVAGPFGEAFAVMTGVDGADQGEPVAVGEP